MVKKLELYSGKGKLKKSNEKLLGMLILVVAIVVIVVAADKNFQQEKPAKVVSEEDLIHGPVHWHVQIDTTICGQRRELPRAVLNGTEDYVGAPHLHAHNDNRMHLHIAAGQSFEKSRVTLGQFMDIMEVPFDKDRIFEYKNGIYCPGSKTAGKVRFFVMSNESSLFRDYVPVDGEVVQIVFE